MNFELWEFFDLDGELRNLELDGRNFGCGNFMGKTLGLGLGLGWVNTDSSLELGSGANGF